MLYKQTVITVYYFYDIVFTVGGAGNRPLVVVSVTIIIPIIAIIVIAYIIVRHKCKFTLHNNYYYCYSHCYSIH